MLYSMISLFQVKSVAKCLVRALSLYGMEVSYLLRGIGEILVDAKVIDCQGSHFFRDFVSDCLISTPLDHVDGINWLPVPSTGEWIQQSPPSRLEEPSHRNVHVSVPSIVIHFFYLCDDFP